MHIHTHTHNTYTQLHVQDTQTPRTVGFTPDSYLREGLTGSHWRTNSLDLAVREAPAQIGHISTNRRLLHGWCYWVVVVVVCVWGRVSEGTGGIYRS